jgi:ADP-ribose pyrophosphatase
LYDPQREEIVLIEQFRMGAMANNKPAWLLEIVAGGIEEGETPEAVAYREAEEEAGCKIEKLEFISEFYTSPGGTSELLSLYCGKVDTSKIVGGVYGLAEEHEDILVSVISTDEAFELVAQHKIQSAIPIVAIQWLQLNRAKLKTKWATE